MNCAVRWNIFVLQLTVLFRGITAFSIGFIFFTVGSIGF